jgi:hypothetical protein
MTAERRLILLRAIFQYFASTGEVSLLSESPNECSLQAFADQAPPLNGEFKAQGRPSRDSPRCRTKFRADLMPPHPRRLEHRAINQAYGALRRSPAQLSPFTPTDSKRTL